MILLILLSQLVSHDGFESDAPTFHGSGAADIICGSGDWYCLIETHKNSWYSGAHGDVTIQNVTERYAGILLGVQNKAFGSGAIVFGVSWNGDVFSYGSYWAYQNGGGLRNPGSYVAVYGEGSWVNPDVIVGAMTRHWLGRYNFGVWNGWNYTFRVRDDGALTIGEAVYKITSNDYILCITQELPDGGTRSADIPWSTP